MVKYHDPHIYWKWVMRRLFNDGVKNGAHIKITKKDGTSLEYKISLRGYGMKWVSWEPFRVYKHISEIDLNETNKVEVLSVGEGELLFPESPIRY